jgi:hypothetical protein
VRSKTKTIEAANLSKDNLENVLGKDSYAWITPQIFGISANSAIPLTIHNYGNHALTGVSIKIADQEAFEERTFDSDRALNDYFFGPQVQIGTIAGGATEPIPQVISKLIFGEKKQRTFAIYINAQNGEVDEYIAFRLSQNPKQPNMLAFCISVDLNSAPLENGKFRPGRQLEFTGWSDEGYKGAGHYHDLKK